MQKPQYRAPIFLLALALLAFTLPAASQNGSDNTLTTAEVECNEIQLQNLLEKLELEGSNNGSQSRDFTLFVTYSNPFGFYEGLAVANQDPLISSNAVAAAQRENFLAFHINPSVRSFLLNPARTPLDQISLEREESSSNLVGSGDANTLNVFLNPTLNPNGGSARLQINNLQATGAACAQSMGLSTKPGRGLAVAGLLTNCHTSFSDFDRTMFALLQRMLRVEVQTPGSGDAEVAIYRGEDPFTYRVDIYPLNNSGDASLGKLALLLTVETSPQGQLTGGNIRALPDCTGASSSELGCTSTDVPMQVYIFPPLFGGTQTRLASGPSAVFNFQPGTTTNPVSLSWSTLLNGTTWNP